MFVKKKIMAAFIVSAISMPAIAGHPGTDDLNDSASTAPIKVFSVSNPENAADKKVAISKSAKEKAAVERISAVNDSVAKKISSQAERDTKLVNSTLVPENVKKLPRVKKNEWVINKGEKLSAVLERWAKHEGWTHVWNSELDPVMAASTKFKGTYRESVISLFKALKANADAKKEGYFILDLYHPNTVARVTMLNPNQASTTK